LDDDDIEEVIGDIARLGASLPYQYPGLDSTIELEDIEKHRILGKGEFAVVYLCSNKKTKKTYALKTLSKLHLLEHTTNAIEATKHEKEIMQSIHHEFIMSMYASFQDDRYVYLLLPLFQGKSYHSYSRALLIGAHHTIPSGLTNASPFFCFCPGGELFGLIYHEGGSRYGLKDDDAIFYSACVVEALGHLHSR